MAEQDFAFDPSILPSIKSERKGSLLLRSNHMKYRRGVLDSRWHKDREALPMEYDISTCDSKDKNLLRATYNRIGNLTDGSMRDDKSTQHDNMDEAMRLKEDHRTRETLQTMVTYDNFVTVPFERETGRPERGYGSVLPRYAPDYRKMHLVTNHREDYQYPFEWTPVSPSKKINDSDVKFRRTVSQFADTDGTKRSGSNTFMDYDGAVISDE